MGYYYVARRPLALDMPALFCNYTCYTWSVGNLEKQPAVIAQQRIVCPHCTSHITTLEKSISCTWATPLLPRPFNVPLHSVPQVPSSLWTLPEGNNIMIGKECFVTCSKMVFKDMYAVCVKVIGDALPLSSIIEESSVFWMIVSTHHIVFVFAWKNVPL